VRLVVRPFGSARKGSLLRSWRAGTAFTNGRRTSGLWEVEGRTIGGTASFTLPVFVNGTEQRLGIESTWSPGPLRIGAEWMRLDAERLRQGLDGSDLPGLRTEGWYVSAAWRLLGRGSKTALDSRWRQALEVGARIESLAFGIDPRRPAPLTVDEALPLPAHRVLTLGANWAGRRWIRIQGNLLLERVAGGAPPLDDGERRLGAVLRLQLTL
jgi:hypothetical protein